MNGAKERKEGFYSESDSRPSPSKMRFSRMQHAVNFENDNFKSKGEDNHAKSEPFSSSQSSKSKNDNINQKSDKKDIKKEFDQKAYYKEIYDRRDPKMPEFFKREDKNDSSDKNAGAQSGKNRAYEVCMIMYKIPYFWVFFSFNLDPSFKNYREFLYEMKWFF